MQFEVEYRNIQTLNYVVCKPSCGVYEGNRLNMHNSVGVSKSVHDCMATVSTVLVHYSLVYYIDTCTQSVTEATDSAPPTSPLPKTVLTPGIDTTRLF